MRTPICAKRVRRCKQDEIKSATHTVKFNVSRANRVREITREIRGYSLKNPGTAVGDHGAKARVRIISFTCEGNKTQRLGDRHRNCLQAPPPPPPRSANSQVFLVRREWYRICMTPRGGWKTGLILSPTLLYPPKTLTASGVRNRVPRKTDFFRPLNETLRPTETRGSLFRNSVYKLTSVAESRNLITYRIFVGSFKTID